MMFYCPFCGARRFTCWPEFWPWQYQGDLFCSENCWICDATKKQRERNGYKMARMKKDGTPAKKPGRKPTIKLDGELMIETPEAHNVDIVETPEQAVIKNKVVDIMEELKIRNPLRYEEFTVREVEGLFGRYRRSDIGQETYIDFEPPECVDVISNTLTQWSSFMKELKRAAQVLGVEL